MTTADALVHLKSFTESLQELYGQYRQSGCVSAQQLLKAVAVDIPYMAETLTKAEKVAEIERNAIAAGVDVRAAMEMVNLEKIP